MAIIYKITNLLNGKIYIGKSLKNDPNYYGSGLKIVNAVNKHGKEYFNKEIVEECAIDIVNEREIYWIDQYNCTCDKIGYNISVGGTGGNHYRSSLEANAVLELNLKISEGRKNGKQPEYSELRLANQKKIIQNVLENRVYKTHPKKYIIYHAGQLIKINNLSNFCVDYNLHDSEMCQIANGKKIYPHRGFYCFYDEFTDKEIFDKIEKLMYIQQNRKTKFKEKMSKIKKQKCEHCNTSSSPSNYSRWHGKNCRKK